MEPQAWFTVGIVLLALIALVREFAAPDLVLMAALFALAATGILTPSETFAGFANPAVATIGALFIVSAALRETGALDLTLGRILSPTPSVRPAMLRIVAPVAALSAFLNNAPIVAMMTPSIIDWGRRMKVAPSRFLIPLSYAAILGSTTTMVGTSVNLTVAGLIIDAGMPEMTFFELAPVGIAVCITGLVYLVLIGPLRLPDRQNPSEELGERRREFTAAMEVQTDCPLVDRTVEEAGLRRLPGLFLVEIDRQARIITPVAPDDIIRAGDRLIFAGVVSTIVELQRIRGLVPVALDDDEAFNAPGHRLVEAVISRSSPLVNQSVRDANFRTVFDAAVIAVHRNGERVTGKIGEIVLRPGDTLLLQCSEGFTRAHRNSPDFYLISDLGSGRKPRYERAWIAISILIAMVLVVSIGGAPISIAAFVAGGLLLLTRCITGPQARASVEWSILVVIGASLGIAVAMTKTGAAAAVAHFLVGFVEELGPHAALAMVYLTCLVMAETLHHNAAVAIMFPIAVAAAGELGVDPRGFVMACALGSCCAFASPVSYQTHLIVYGPGGYRFTDFVRIGLPLDAICAAVAIVLIPIVWPF